jgi:NADH-quinone oxidoreductase subunit E
MSDHPSTSINEILSASQLKKIDHWVAKYPKDEKQSAVMSALMIVQEDHGYLTEALMDAIAQYLDMPPIAVYEVATFYSMYDHKPVGRHRVNVCTNISCQLRGSGAIVDQLEKSLAIQLGETTTDGMFTLRGVECLGACVNAPMMQVNKDFHENLTVETIDSVLDQYR